LIEPASRSDEAFDITLVEEAIIAMGLKPMRGQHVLNEFGYLAGQDKDRAADLTAMFADKDVRAIFAVRGGWGSARLLPFVDWDVVRANPKFVLGYSDITRVAHGHCRQRWTPSRCTAPMRAAPGARLHSKVSARSPLTVRHFSTKIR
jgi:muramoyltetrapeptide carboxypeptidase LdcA involved in peptidoglycan recycling